MKVIIIGAGGHGRVVRDILLRSRRYQAAGYLDANASLARTLVDGLPVLGDISLAGELRREGIQGAIVAIGDNPTRRMYAAQLVEAGLSLINAIHPSANLARSVRLGANVVIAAGATLCAHVDVGDSAILNTGCIVDHESRIGNAAHICPGAKLAGRVDIDDYAFVGLGASVIQNITIGRWATVGAGAVVIHDVPAGATAVGVPARVIRHDPVPEPPGDALAPRLGETVTAYR